jgi:hypothetical protein
MRRGSVTVVILSIAKNPYAFCNVLIEASDFSGANTKTKGKQW